MWLRESLMRSQEQCTHTAMDSINLAASDAVKLMRDALDMNHEITNIPLDVKESFES